MVSAITNGVTVVGGVTSGTITATSTTAALDLQVITSNPLVAGTISFDFEGIYDEVIPHQSIAYTMSDGRKVLITFKSENDITTVTEIFDPETQNPADLQKAGWQAILDNFKRYVEQ